MTIIRMELPVEDTSRIEATIPDPMSINNCKNEYRSLLTLTIRESGSVNIRVLKNAALGSTNYGPLVDKKVLITYDTGEGATCEVSGADTQLLIPSA